MHDLIFLSENVLNFIYFERDTEDEWLNCHGFTIITYGVIIR